jgi:hypothetical protein
MKANFLWLLAILVGATSCVTQERCNQKFPPTTVTEYLERVVYRDTVLPGAIVRDTVLLNDTLVIRELRTNVREVRDTANSVELRIWIDRYNQLQATCEALEKKVTVKDTHSTTTTTERIKEKPSWWVKNAPWVLFAVAFIALVFVGVSNFRR